MNQRPLLTLGIPTYDRPQKVRELLADMSAPLKSRQFDVLVIDDGHNPATREAAHEHVGHPGFVYLRNDANLGYAGTFCRLIETCQTEYIMALADDDLLATENIGCIEAVLTKERPAFASPNYRLGSAVYRGFAAT